MTQTLEDSANFPDEDIAQAMDASEAEIAAKLKDLRCRCGTLYTSREHLLRRRAPWHYWVLRLSCKVCRDTQQLIFRLTDPMWRLPQ
jgi:hypothetical protein